MSTDSARGTQRPPADEPSDRPSTAVERPSALRIFASALAAMTATALLSTLGVAGTIAGAAIASVITVLANFVYSASLQRTADKVTYVTALQRERIRQARAGSLPVEGEAPTDQLVDDTAAAAVELDATQLAVAEPPERVATEQIIAKQAEDTSTLSRLRAALRSVVKRVGWRRIVGTIVAVFVLTLALVTVIELAAGRTLTDVVRNQEGSGTSVFGGTTTNEVPSEDVQPGPGEVPPAGPAPTETPEPTETPQPTEAPDAPATPEPTEEPAPLEETPTPPPVEPEQPPPPGEGAPDPELPPAPGADAL